MARPKILPTPDTFTARIGSQIQRRRAAASLSVAEAARRANAPAPTWYHWESGRHMSLDALPRIAAALGCTVRQLIPVGE